jgi:hypothetical protein
VASLTALDQRRDLAGVGFETVPHDHRLDLDAAQAGGADHGLQGVLDVGGPLRGLRPTSR